MAADIYSMSVNLLSDTQNIVPNAPEAKIKGFLLGVFVIAWYCCELAI